MSDNQVNRRGLLHGLGCCASLPVVALLATGASAQETQAVIALPVPANVTPEQALDLLKSGNTGFITDAPYRAAETRERRLEIAADQKPFAVLVGCSDSRVSPELLFGRRLGELFIIRVAGNTVDQIGLGSIEYAVQHLGVPLIVVLGHERCGAVAAAVEVVENNATFEGAIGAMVEPIIPAVLSVKDAEGDLLENSVRANVERVVARLLSSGIIIEGLVEQRKLMVVGARYDLEDGIVEFI